MLCWFDLTPAVPFDEEELPTAAVPAWLHEFGPDSEARGWAWWDLTDSSDGTARIWVDPWGESFFACDELRWLAYVAGSAEVGGPPLAKVERWAAALPGDGRS